ncbi:primosomal protein N' [Glaciecola sp. 2405UD65-10]|uniref:primosomal protein N' n=1 Tax=Glaciecola sp. 2405UD65-10 TaxID=3397244 RepID=UPI003B5BDD1B
MYLSVALAVPLHRDFAYSISKEQLNDYPIGGRVQVPFGNKKRVGVVLAVNSECEFDAAKVKPAIKPLDTAPIFSQELMSLAKWISRFYIYPMGEVLSAMLPTLLRKGESAELTALEYLHVCKESLAKISQSDLIETFKRSKKQAQLFQYISSHPMLLKDAKKAYSPSIVKGLVDKSLVHVNLQTPKTNTWQENMLLGEKKRANPEQAIAIASINQAEGYTGFLIEGVTGSGKTEVYLQVIEEVLQQGQQVLILVPEIGLTPQTVKRFEERFGNVVAVWHSALTDNERLQVWQQAKHNQMAVFIGTRSSVFLPLAKPGMIIVDEEHDESYKQQDKLRYHARDIAAYRANQYNIPLVLGTATPSLESLHNALSHKYRHLILAQRAGSASMPTQHLIDLGGQVLDAGIAPSMMMRIEQQLKAGNQVLIYVNRRGYAPALICEQCGHVETCLDCDNPFTVHLSAHNLQCHRCGKFEPYQHSCKKCHSKNVSTQGIGTEQIQQILAKRFSDYSCVRIDSDSTRGKRKLNELLTEINQNKHQLLVGTQILSKGHHFPNVTLALILNVDSFLFSSDYRAPEKLAQLVTQLSGRAGRENKPGEVWLQSYQVGHPLLQDLVNNGYSHFARTLLSERIAAKLPPASYQAAIRVEHTELAPILNFLEYAGQLLGQFKQLEFVGPFPAGVEKKQGRYRFITVAQSNSSAYLVKAMQQAKEALEKHQFAAKLRWIVDIMPTDFS